MRRLADKLAGQGVKVDDRLVWDFARAEGLSFKKSVLPAEQLRPKVARRKQWRKVPAEGRSTGDTVIMDILGSHKGNAVRRAIRGAGAGLLFLPSYSPDLNPIEQVSAKLKHLFVNSRYAQT